jgi:HEAT repeat protein
MAKESQAPPSASDALRQPERPRVRALDSPAGILLRNFFAAMSAAGDDAEEQYRRALIDLRKQADVVVVEIARAHSDCNARDYPTRWAHVHAAAELRHPAALPFLRNLILTPIPPEESPDPHSFSTAAEETILRTTAVEGIGHLARDRADAIEALFEALKQPSLSIRRAAVQSLLASSRGRRLQARIAKALPEDQRFLLALKAVDVRDVPQIKRPERQLSEAGRRGGIAPAPSLPGDESATAGNKSPTRKE